MDYREAVQKAQRVLDKMAANGSIIELADALMAAYEEGKPAQDHVPGEKVVISRLELGRYLNYKDADGEDLMKDRARMDFIRLNVGTHRSGFSVCGFDTPYVMGDDIGEWIDKAMEQECD